MQCSAEVVPRFEFEVVIPPEGGFVSLHSSNINKNKVYFENDNNTLTALPNEDNNEQNDVKNETCFDLSMKIEDSDILLVPNYLTFINTCKSINEKFILNNILTKNNVYLNSNKFNCFFQSSILSLNNYIVIKQIGLGQFSHVYRAICKYPKHMHVALKVIKIFEMVDAKAQQDCIKEVDFLKKLDHPNIITYLASFIEHNQLIIVLELADAGDLQQMIQYFKRKKRLIPEKTVWKFFVQICSGLEHMHSKRIMHRDIKPANVFITAQGQIKLGDLGLSRYFESQNMAAESLDIWSLGCLLYEMAVLQSPFYEEHMNLYKLCQKIQCGDYMIMSEKLHSFELRSLVNACLQSNPSDRLPIAHIYDISKSVFERYLCQKK